MATPASSPTPLFLLGVGFIGGSLLTSLLESKKYSITALTRSEDQAKVLKDLGVKPLFGSLDSEELIVDAVGKNDIIIHAATADDVPSVKAILKGLAERDGSLPAPVYIHTSGTGVLADDGSGFAASPKIYSDTDPASIDALADSQPHRNVDLLIKNAVEGNKVGKARVAILLPPLIYGIGTGPFNKMTIQVPGWIKDSVQKKQVFVFGKGLSIWNNIHIQNLVSAYEFILSHLLAAPSPPPSSYNLYWFAETSSHTWLSLGEHMSTLLTARGLVDKPLGYRTDKGYMGSNSRSSADRLRSMGWKGDRTSKTVEESMEEELDEMMKDMESLYTGGLESR